MNYIQIEVGFAGGVTIIGWQIRQPKQILERSVCTGKNSSRKIPKAGRETGFAHTGRTE